MRRTAGRALIVILWAALGALPGCTPVSTMTTRGKVVRGAIAGAAFGAAVGCTEAAFVHADRAQAYYIGCGAGLLVGMAVGAVAGPFVLRPIASHAPPLSDKEKLMVSGGGPFSGRSARSAPATRPPREKLTLRGVHFNYNESVVRPEDAPLLDEAADTLQAHPNVTTYVDGYCDAKGTDKYNHNLSLQRAQAVAKYLAGKGIEASRLIPRGMGKTNFVATNDTDDGRAQNRRVELIPSF